MKSKCDRQRPALGRPFRAGLHCARISPGRCPGLWLARPVGASASEVSRLPAPTSRLALRRRCCNSSAPMSRLGPRRNSSAPTARINFSPGQRPGKPVHKNIEALKGRANLCHNPSRGCTSTLSSAPRTANPPCTTRCAIPCTVTWPRSCKTWVARPFLSTRWRTTSTSSLNWAARSRSVTPWNRSRKFLRMDQDTRRRICRVCLAGGIWGIRRFGVECHRGA